MSSTEAVEELLVAPDLPNAVARLSAVLESERERRDRFYDEITPSMKAEFINGEIIVHSPVSRAHLEASGNLLSLLKWHATKNGLGEVYSEKALVCLTRNDYEPDITFFNSAKVAQFSANHMKFPAPDLAVEILSSSTEHRDRGIKFRDCAAHGVAEYWLVNTDTSELEQYKAQNGTFHLAIKSNSGDVQSSAIPGLRLPIAAIFDSKLAQQELLRILQS
jgi:Uma2 family endonuclease